MSRLRACYQLRENYSVIRNLRELVLQFREIRIKSFAVVVGRDRLVMSDLGIVFAVDAGGSSVNKL